MPIYDLEKTKELVDLYDNFRDLQAKAVSITAQQTEIATLLLANPLFTQNISADEQAFFAAANANCNTFVQAAPVDPDAPVIPKPVPPAPPAQNQSEPQV